MFDFPSPILTDPIAIASLTPIASSTRDGPRSPELHAEPDDNENRRMATISESASMRSKLTFRLPGNLNARGPFTETSGISATRRSHKLVAQRRQPRRFRGHLLAAQLQRRSAIPIAPGH